MQRLYPWHCNILKIFRFWRCGKRNLVQLTSILQLKLYSRPVTWHKGVKSCSLYLKRIENRLFVHLARGNCMSVRPIVSRLTACCRLQAYMAPCQRRQWNFHLICPSVRQLQSCMDSDAYSFRSAFQLIFQQAKSAYKKNFPDAFHRMSIQLVEWLQHPLCKREFAGSLPGLQMSHMRE